MKKKLLAILFVAMVAMLTFAVSASAATGTTGDCQFNYDESTGVLTITGNGAPASLNAARNAKEIVFGEGVTTIPNAFCYNNKNLTKVTLSSTITTIEKNAFQLATALTTVEVPANSQLTTIGEQAFWKSGITAVDFGDNVKVVGQSAFRECPALVSVDLGNSLTSIGQYAFGKSYALQTVVAGGTYTDIPANAFLSCAKLADVTIADTVTSIGTKAFLETAALTSIDVPSALVTIGDDAFKSSGLTGAVVLPNTVKTIGTKAFYMASNITSINLPEGLTTIGGYCFSLTGITSVTIPSTITAIPVKAFDNCTSLASVVMNNTLTSIGNYAFSASGITSIVIPETCTTLGNGIFWGCTKLTSAEIKSPITAIPSKLFYNCTKLSTANIPETVQNIQPYSFYKCAALTSIEIPAGLRLLYCQAFEGTTNLKCDIVIPGNLLAPTYSENGSTLSQIGDKCFKDSGITSVTIGEGVETIGTEAFRNAKSITTLTLPTTCTTLGNSCFMYTGITDAYVPKSVTTFGNTTVFCPVSGATKPVVHTEADAEAVIAWVTANPNRATLDTTYVPGGEVEPEFEGVKLNVVIDGTTATATLVLENAPELTSVAFNVAYTDKLTLTAATTNLDGYTTDPAIANPVKFVWINGLANADINGTIATFTFTVAEGAEITAEDFTITYDADDVCAFVDGALANVELATIVVIG